MPADHSRFLYTILKQLDLKSIDWAVVASQLGITNGHAARMRFSRFKQAMEGVVPSPRKRAGASSARPRRVKPEKGVVVDKKSADGDEIKAEEDDRLGLAIMSPAGSGKNSSNNNINGSSNSSSSITNGGGHRLLIKEEPLDTMGIMAEPFVDAQRMPLDHNSGGAPSGGAADAAAAAYSSAIDPALAHAIAPPNMFSAAAGGGAGGAMMAGPTGSGSAPSLSSPPSAGGTGYGLGASSSSSPPLPIGPSRRDFGPFAGAYPPPGVVISLADSPSPKETVKKEPCWD